jgi:integrase
VRAALDARRERLSPDRGDYIWESAEGTLRDRNNVRNRLLEPVIDRAEKLLEQRGQRALPGVTPHTFRRTAMTYWAWAERSQVWAKTQAGHRSAKLTMEVYQQGFPSDKTARELVLNWLDA